MPLNIAALFNRVSSDRRFEPIYAAIGGMAGADIAHLDLPKAALVGIASGAVYAILQYGLGSPRQP